MVLESGENEISTELGSIIPFFGYLDKYGEAE